MNFHESDFWSAPIADMLVPFQTKQNGVMQEPLDCNF